MARKVVTFPAPIEFDIRTPATNAVLRKRVAWSRALGYAEIQEGAEKPGCLTIVANGPSAVKAFDQPFSGPVASLNGSLRLFQERDISPQFWAACDPQRMVAGFLKRPPLETSYLLASKCHRAAFRALRGRHVRIWHIDDLDGLPGAIPTATSITLVAMSLFRRMGWREFRVFGWDGCYLDGKDHAVPQRHNAGHNVEIEVAGRVFQSTATWAAEAQDAFAQLSNADYRVHIEGDGMIRAVVDHKVPAYQTRPAMPG